MRLLGRPVLTRRVTSSEVARHSGVSRATVSYVLNGAYLDQRDH